MIARLGFLLITILLPASTRGAEPKYMDQPFAVIAVPGFGQVKTKLEQFGKLSGNMQLSERFSAIENTLGKVDGIDRKRAMGGVLVLERANLTLPAVVVLLPVTNGTKVIADLRKKYPVFQTISKGKWRVNIPGLVLYVSLQNDYLAITQSRPTLAVVTDELLRKMSESTANSDMTTTLNFDGMSDPLRDRILNGFDIDLNKAIQRRSEDTDETLQRRTQIVELIRSTLKQLVNDTQTLTAGLKLDSEVHLHLDFQARADSEFEKLTSSLMLNKRQSSVSPQKELPLHLEFGFRLPEEAQRIAQVILTAAGDNFLKELEPKLSQAESTSVSTAMDQLRESLLHEELEGFVSVYEAEEQRMTILGSMAVSDEQKLSAAMETVLPHVQKSDSISEIEMDIKGSQPIRLHRLKKNDQLKQSNTIYGPDASLYVGTSLKVIWGGIGGSQTPQLLSKLQQAKSAGSQTVLSLNLSLDRWLKLAEKNDMSTARVQRFRQAIPDGQHDQLQFDLKATENGLQATIRAQQDYLKLFGSKKTQTPSR